jgi:hypothetical protein
MADGARGADFGSKTLDRGGCAAKLRVQNLKRDFAELEILRQVHGAGSAGAEFFEDAETAPEKVADADFAVFGGSAEKAIGGLGEGEEALDRREQFAIEATS